MSNNPLCRLHLSGVSRIRIQSERNFHAVYPLSNQDQRHSATINATLIGGHKSTPVYGLRNPITTKNLSNSISLLLFSPTKFCSALTDHWIIPSSTSIMPKPVSSSPRACFLKMLLKFRSPGFR